MAFLEDLGKKISQTSQDVVKKTKDSTEIYKLKGMISDEDRKINATFQQIGKLYYNLHKDSYEPSFKNMILQIIESENKKIEYSKQIETIKGVKKCPHCNNEIAYVAKFCNICGSKVEAEETDTSFDATPNGIVCKNCNATNSESAAFCKECGTKLQ